MLSLILATPLQGEGPCAVLCTGDRKRGPERSSCFPKATRPGSAKPGFVPRPKRPIITALSAAPDPFEQLCTDTEWPVLRVTTASPSGGRETERRGHRPGSRVQIQALHLAKLSGPQSPGREDGSPYLLPGLPHVGACVLQQRETRAP